MLNRALPWLRVSPDAIITVVLTARNQRDWIDLRKLGTWLGGGRVAVRFRVTQRGRARPQPGEEHRPGPVPPAGHPRRLRNLLCAPARPPPGRDQHRRPGHGPRSRCRSWRRVRRPGRLGRPPLPGREPPAQPGPARCRDQYPAQPARAAARPEPARRREAAARAGPAGRPRRPDRADRAQRRGHSARPHHLTRPGTRRRHRPASARP